MLPRISVIIPVFNGEHTIEAAVLSVATQTYDNIELLVMDGGSKDGTVLMLERLSKIYRLQYMSEKDKGVYDAMNKGIARATGEWIFFLGADDVLYDKDVFKDIFLGGGLDVKNLDIIYGDVLLKEQNKIYGGAFNKWRILSKNISHQAIFYNRALFDKNGHYDLKYSILADYVFNLKLFADKSFRAQHISKIVTVFAEEGLSSTKRDMAFKKDRNSLIWSQYSLLHYLYGAIIVPFVDLIQKKVLAGVRKKMS
ncbi:glycosyltransferase family 2 protein [Polluticoccus soli]|uniref:glycosyltransferase family 2 protein n=1 Tax=Polluticoccus soli TaxID=3034150 RepID=UPI0023E28C9D|nr:glycosyltransferase family 2 protein [Flavipsychrobacter sp. JY13-12]